MPNDDFAPYLKFNGCFVVLNTSPQVKTIKIFHYPINYGMTRDILQIPGVAEDDIRASLLKGELQHKIRAHDIVVICSDIDLLQFNAAQKSFLQAAGIVNGLDVSGSGGGISEADHETLRQLIHFLPDGPGDGFLSGAYKTTTPTGNPFPTNITWWVSSAMSQKIFEKLITYNASKFPVTITYNVYDFDGVTIKHSATDTITYANNAFESTRTRSIF